MRFWSAALFRRFGFGLSTGRGGLFGKEKQSGGKAPHSKSAPYSRFPSSAGRGRLKTSPERAEFASHLIAGDLA
jgi:hypothetical protein